MSDAAIFVTVVAGLFVLRFVAATIVFCWLLSAGDRCPHCDAHTLWIQSPVWSRVAPWLRPSWCLACGWQGMLRHGRPTPTAGVPLDPGRDARAADRRPGPFRPSGPKRHEAAD